MMAFLSREQSTVGFLPKCCCCWFPGVQRYLTLNSEICKHYPFQMGSPGGSEVKASTWNAGDPGLILGSGRSPGEGNGNPLQYSCLENPVEGGAW